MARCTIGQRFELLLHIGLVALGAQALQLVDLAGAHGGIIDLEHIDRALVFGLVFIDADHGLAA